jgi:hypothetical protein
VGGKKSVIPLGKIKIYIKKREREREYMIHDIRHCTMSRSAVVVLPNANSRKFWSQKR